MKKIVLVVGTRPNFMKAFPVYEALKPHFDLYLIHTGQHYDKNMSKIFFDELNFSDPDFYLNIKSRTQTSQLGEIITKLEDVLNTINPDLLIVFGDVTSTLAAALTANKMGIKLAHVEAGLRSYDMTMPEEVNRILTDNISDYLFVTEESGIENLIKIGISKDRIFLVGNTMIDSLIKYQDKIENTKYYESLKLEKNNYIVLTLHRPSNVDDNDYLKRIFNEIEKVAQKKRIIYPVHPRIKDKIKDIVSENIILIDPLGYLEFINLVSNSYCVITDSGGIQEETTFLNIPCLTLRSNTERPSTFVENGGTNKLVNMDNLFDEYKNLKINNIVIKQNNLFDGKASDRILNVIQKIV